MKRCHLIMIVGLVFVFCSSPTNQSTDDYKNKILNYSDECSWYSSSYIADTSKYAFIIDSADSEYAIQTMNFYSSSNTTYKFTHDSVFMEYHYSASGYGIQCEPYIINNGDTIAGDSVKCHMNFSRAEAWGSTLKKGTWGCDDNTLYFHFTEIATLWDSTVIDTLEQLSYYFSVNADTLYIGKDGIYQGFIKR